MLISLKAPATGRELARVFVGRRVGGVRAGIGRNRVVALFVHHGAASTPNTAAEPSHIHVTVEMFTPGDAYCHRAISSVVRVAAMHGIVSEIGRVVRAIVTNSLEMVAIGSSRSGAVVWVMVMMMLIFCMVIVIVIARGLTVKMVHDC